MSRFKRGQIWLVNFDPGIGHEYKKTRPALIVQKDRYIDDHALLTVIPISSQIDKPGELDIAIAKAIDGQTLIEAERRNRERENPSTSSGQRATQPTVVEQLQAAIKEMQNSQSPNLQKGDVAHESVSNRN